MIFRFFILFVFRSGQGPTKPLDPQRQPRIIPMISSPEETGPGIVTTAHADYTTTSGNTRTDVHTDEYVMRTGDGRKVTKTVTEQRVTRYNEMNGPSADSRRRSMGSLERPSRSASRSPLIWQPSSQDVGSSQGSARSPLMWRPPSQASADTGTRSANRSPVMWQSTPGKLSTDHIQKSQSLLDVHFGHKQRATPSSRSLSPAVHKRSTSTPSEKKAKLCKENVDPIMAAEQAKWEKLHQFDQTPKHTFSMFEESKMGSKKYVPPKMNDPNYPMFEVPTYKWSPPKSIDSSSTASSSPKKLGPPVPPKPVSPSPSPIPFTSNERSVAGVDRHYPGMIRPPQQPDIKPAPIPPPMPPVPTSPTKQFNVVPFHSLRKSNGLDELDPSGSRPDHLPVFGPRVVFAPDDDSGMMSPDRHDASSDIIALHRSKFRTFILW